MWRSCLEAVDQRHALMHRGQRDVDEQELVSFLASITETYFSLENQKTS